MKTKILPTAILLAFSAAPALAHDFWAGVVEAEKSRPAVVKIGFGHNFPEGEALEAEKMHRYEPLTMLGPGGTVPLGPGPEPRLAVTAQSLAEGGYLVLAATKTSFFTRGPEGSKLQPKNEVPGAASCSFGASFGKAVFNIGAGAETGFLSRPVGQTLEIVPQVNPASIKVGQKLPVQALLKGRPLGQARLEATFAGFGDGQEGTWAFSASTDKDGRVNIIPLRPGPWLAKITFSKPYDDLEKCDMERYNATLTFTITE